MRGKIALTTHVAIIGLIGSWGVTSPARAHELDTSMHRVSFAVERSRDVENDWVRAVVGITDEDPDAARVAERVNDAAEWALGVAKKQRGVAVKSGGYHTFPVSEKGRIRRWRASQEIVIEGSDVAPIGELVAKLQERLQLRSLSFTVSPERRRGVESELVAEGLAAFRERAELVRRSLDAASYEIVAISIDTGGGAPRPVYRQREMMMESSSKMAGPALEAGTTRVRVNASGTIELD